MNKKIINWVVVALILISCVAGFTTQNNLLLRDYYKIFGVNLLNAKAVNTTFLNATNATFPLFTNCNLETNANGGLTCGTDDTGASDLSGKVDNATFAVSTGLQINKSDASLWNYANYTIVFASNTSGWDTSSADDILLVQCVQPSWTNVTYNSELIVYDYGGDQLNKSEIPTCTGTQKLTYDGSTLTCAVDQTGGGSGTSYWYVDGSMLTVNVSKSGTNVLNASLGWGNLTAIPVNLDLDKTDDYKKANLTIDYPNLDTDSTDDIVLAQCVQPSWTNVTYDSELIVYDYGGTQINKTVLNGNCTGTDKVVGFYANGTRVCVADATGTAGAGKGGDNIYLYNDTTTIYLNETKLNLTISDYTSSTTYYPTSFAVIEGTPSAGNTLNNLSYYDSQTFNITEGNGVDSFGFYVNFTGVTHFDYIQMRERYIGSTAHHINIEMYDYGTSSWETYDTISTQSTLIIKLLPSLDSASHINNGLVQIRFDHIENGNTNHKLIIDFIHLIDGFSSVTTTMHDGLSGRDNIVNHPWAFDITGTRKVTSINVTGRIIAKSINATFGNFTNLTVSKLLSCTAIETNAKGELMCGTDDTGAGGVQTTWTNYSLESNFAINWTKYYDIANNNAYKSSNFTTDYALADNAAYKYSNYSASFISNTSGWDKSTTDDYSATNFSTSFAAIKNSLYKLLNFTADFGTVKSSLYKLTNFTSNFETVKGALYKKANLTTDYPNLDTDSTDDIVLAQCVQPSWTNVTYDGELTSYVTNLTFGVSTGLQANKSQLTGFIKNNTDVTLRNVTATHNSTIAGLCIQRLNSTAVKMFVC